MTRSPGPDSNAGGISADSADPADDWSHVPRNLARIRAAIGEAAQRAGRDPQGVTLVAVTKTVPLAGIRAAITAGQALFGENRVQEGLPKLEALRDTDARFHFIGQLQTNKVKRAVAFAMIESVDSVRLAQAIDRRAARPLPVLLEVNVTGEAGKSGFSPDAVADALAAIRPLPHLDVRGLMTVAPLTADPEQVRPVFRRLRALGDALGLKSLSMGMTNDFHVAIEEGATMVRIGRAIFGDR